ncbi:flippase [Rubrobacter marinus]|nr:flippase [Rubrobacter marinus]
MDRGADGPGSASPERSVFSRLKRGAVEAFVLHGAGVGLLFLMHAVFARAVGEGGYGSFSYALAITAVLGIVAPLGWPTALLRFVSEYLELGRWGLLQGALRRAYQTTLVVSLAISLVLLGLSYLVPGDAATGLRYAALLLPLVAFVGLRRKALRALGKLKASIVLEEVVLPVGAVAGVLLLVLALGGIGVSGIVLAYFASALLVFALSSWWLLRSLPDEAREAKPEYRYRAWMAVALPMAFGGLNQMLMNRADVLVLGTLASDETVGLYNAAARIAILITFSLSAVNAVVVPMISAAYHGGRRRQARSLQHRAMLLGGLGALPPAVVVLLFPEFLLGFFGPGFVEAAPVLRILALGQLVNAATGPVGFALLMTGRERAFAATLAVAAVATVVGCLVVVPIYGAVGAAVVTATSVAALNLWQYGLSGRAYS